MALAFDASFYLSTYPDVAAAISRGTIQSAEQHYNDFGRFESRNPSAYFDTAFYLAQNQDVAQARINPFQHFLQFGAAEGRFENNTADAALDTNGNNRADEFDSAAYLAANKDVADAITAGTLKSAYQHFVLYGQFEGRPGVNVGPFTNSGVVPGTGATQTLTTNIDNVAGSTGADTFVGTLAATGSTLQSGDVINGGSGVDTLRVVASAATGAVAPQLSSVETVEYQGFGAGTNTINLASSTGVQNVNLVNGDSSLTLTNQANIVALGASNTTGGVLTATYAASAVSGATDVQNVALNNTANTAVVVNGVETINIAATGTNTVAQVVGNAVTTVNVSGAGSLALANTFAATTTTFNASTNTGGVSAIFAAGGNVAVTGGTGADTFNFGNGLTAAATGVAGDVVNGGEGFDTVRVTNSGDLSAATAVAQFGTATLTSIERVAFDGTGVTLNGSTFNNASITNIEFNTVGGDTINNAGSARTYEFGAANTGDAVFNMNAASTTVNVNLSGTNTATATNGASATAEIAVLDINLAGTQPTTAVATINLSSVGNFTAGTIVAGNELSLTAGTFNSIATIDAASGSTVKILGSAALDIGGFTNNAIVDASAHTGSLVIQGSAFTGELGSSTAATALAAGIDTITLGAGRDVVQFAANGLDSGIIQFTAGTTAGTAAANGNVLVDTINSFTAGAAGDVLDIAGTAASFTALTAATQTAINALSGASATLLEAANTAANGHAEAGWTAFTFQGQTYALYETDTNANNATSFQNVDTLVKLAGVNVTDLVAANFG